MAQKFIRDPDEAQTMSGCCRLNVQDARILCGLLTHEMKNLSGNSMRERLVSRRVRPSKRLDVGVRQVKIMIVTSTRNTMIL
jgi:hypothetical protein